MADATHRHDALDWFRSLEVRTVDIDGVPLRYRQSGPADGPTVILVHGWPLSSSSWRNVARALDERFFSTIMVDLPGAGGAVEITDPGGGHRETGAV